MSDEANRGLVPSLAESMMRGMKGAFGAGLVLIVLPSAALIFWLPQLEEHAIVGLPLLAIFGIMILFGAMALTGRRDGVFVLPGTHNKWVRVADGRVAGFRTFMTGEFYALLSTQSILARTLDAAAPLDEAAFAQGVARSGNGHGLLHNAFGARTLALFDRMGAAPLSSYLSGLLIGEELRTQALDADHDVVLIGSPALTQRYALALRANGIASRTLGAEATWAGLHALHGPTASGGAWDAPGRPFSERHTPSGRTTLAPQRTKPT